MGSLIPSIFLLAQIVGGEFIYSIQSGDTFTSLGARFGVDIRVLAENNKLKSTDRLQSGQTLRIDNRHIAPAHDGVNVLINIPQRMLFYFEGDRVACACPIAAGKPDWRTPVGQFEIVSKEEEPTWHVPASIQDEMRKSGKPVLTHVPPSPENPLGDYWIGLSLPGIGIHSTNTPSSIYKLVTHGCIRLHPENAERVFQHVQIGMQGRIIYESVVIARAGDSVFVEAHPDLYKKESNPFRKVFDAARGQGFLNMLDVAAVQEVIRKRDGIARDVTRR
jgi:L,D-transpeptidase ErfK/SrfK